jgi:hypothetical protein
VCLELKYNIVKQNYLKYYSLKNIVYSFNNILSSLAEKHVGYGNVFHFIHREYPCVVWLVFMSWTTTECCVIFNICILHTQRAYELQVPQQIAIISDLTVVLQR